MFKRILQGLALTAAAISMALAATAPAQADTTPETTTIAGAESTDGVEPMATGIEYCVNYIASQGYEVGPLVRSACTLGITSNAECEAYFAARTDVSPAHARTACGLAGIV